MRQPIPKISTAILTGSHMLSPMEVRMHKKKFNENFYDNNVVVLPSDRLLSKSLNLGMPMFKIIEQPIPSKQRTQETSSVIKYETRKTKRSGGNVEFFGLLNKDSISLLNKRDIKIDKSSSRDIKHFRLVHTSTDLEAQAQKIASHH